MKVCGHREAGAPRCFTSWRSLRWDSLAARTGCQDSQREGARNGERFANSWEQLSPSSCWLGQVMPVIISDWGSQARRVKIPVEILGLLGGLSQTALVLGLTHSLVQGVCLSCVIWAEAVLARLEIKASTTFSEPFCLITPWFLVLTGMGSSHSHVSHEAEGRGKRLPHWILCSFSGSSREKAHSMGRSACSYHCTGFFFRVIAQHLRWRVLVRKRTGQLIAIAIRSHACCGNYIHKRRGCPAGIQSTAGAIWPSLYCSVSYPHLAVPSSCLQTPRGFLNAAQSALMQNHAWDHCFLRYRHDVTYRGVECREEVVFVSWREYVLYAARQLCVPGSPQMLSQNKAGQEYHSQTFFPNSFPPTDTHRHNLHGFFFSFTMEKSLSAFLRRLLLRAVLHNGVSKVKVSCGWWLHCMQCLQYTDFFIRWAGAGTAGANTSKGVQKEKE